MSKLGQIRKKSSILLKNTVVWQLTDLVCYPARSLSAIDSPNKSCCSKMKHELELYALNDYICQHIMWTTNPLTPPNSLSGNNTNKIAFFPDLTLCNNCFHMLFAKRQCNVTNPSDRTQSSFLRSRLVSCKPGSIPLTRVTPMLRVI